MHPYTKGGGGGGGARAPALRPPPSAPPSVFYGGTPKKSAFNGCGYPWTHPPEESSLALHLRLQTFSLEGVPPSPPAILRLATSKSSPIGNITAENRPIAIHRRPEGGGRAAHMFCSSFYTGRSAPFLSFLKVGPPPPLLRS